MLAGCSIVGISWHSVSIAHDARGPAYTLACTRAPGTPRRHRLYQPFKGLSSPSQPRQRVNDELKALWHRRLVSRRIHQDPHLQAGAGRARPCMGAAAPDGRAGDHSVRACARGAGRTGGQGSARPGKPVAGVVLHFSTCTAAAARLCLLEVGLPRQEEQEVEVGEARPVGRRPPRLQVLLQLRDACQGGGGRARHTRPSALRCTCSGCGSRFMHHCRHPHKSWHSCWEPSGWGTVGRGAGCQAAPVLPACRLVITQSAPQPAAATFCRPLAVERGKGARSSPHPVQLQRMAGWPERQSQGRRTLRQQPVLHRKLVLHRTLVVLHSHRHLPGGSAAPGRQAWAARRQQAGRQGPALRPGRAAVCSTGGRCSDAVTPSKQRLMAQRAPRRATIMWGELAQSTPPRAERAGRSSRMPRAPGARCGASMLTPTLPLSPCLPTRK